MSGIVQRTNSSYHRPSNLVPFRWASTGTTWSPTSSPTNPISVSSVNPNTGALGKFPVTYATCLAGGDGNLSFALVGGFTPPITLYAWTYSRVAFANGDNPWLLLGNQASVYSANMDAIGTIAVFKVSEGDIILLQSSSAITGNIYTDGLIQSYQFGAPAEGF